MPSLTDVYKRVLVGRALRSDKLGETLLPKRIALPVFASDAMSSVAYATQEILIVFAIGGVAFLKYTWWAALAVVVVMSTVVAAYRQNVHAYPSGGGDYEVANTNLGPRFGLVVAAALLVDYVLTVAVSTSAGVENLASTPLFGFMNGHKTLVTVLVVTVIVMLNLRGVRESGVAFAIPTYGFLVGILGMVGLGVYKLLFGSGLSADSSHLAIQPATTHFSTAAMLFLGLRAFSSGCTALTGVEAISNGVPAFRKPKSKNAATTLALMGGIALTMFAGVTLLALRAHVHYVDSKGTGSVLLGATGDQPTVIAQIAKAVFGGDRNLPFYYVQLVTAVILVLAANTAFNGFPVLASILAQDRYMPRQMHTRGDRLVYSNGIVLLAAFAIILVIWSQADSTRVIQLYIVGVFVSFTLSQAGMTRHWKRLLAGQNTAAERRSLQRRRAISVFACFTTGTVLVIVLVTKFTKGAWIAVVAMVVLWFLMRGIRSHYDAVAAELALDEDEPATALPSRNHAIVLVSKIHRPTMRALNYARATRPSTLEAVTVGVDEAEARALLDEWDRLDIPVPLKVLDSPYREVTKPILDYVKNVRRGSPRDIVMVFIPEYVVGHWWEHLLHNQSALRLKARLLFTPGVMVTSVPWQLRSAAGAEDRSDALSAGWLRRPERPDLPDIRNVS